eukprot:9504045-Pyramimonas_sp.AAC.1
MFQPSLLRRPPSHSLPPSEDFELLGGQLAGARAAGWFCCSPFAFLAFARLGPQVRRKAGSGPRQEARASTWLAADWPSLDLQYLPSRLEGRSAPCAAPERRPPWRQVPAGPWQVSGQVQARRGTLVGSPPQQAPAELGGQGRLVPDLSRSASQA